MNETEAISLKLDEKNKLTFCVKVQGSSDAKSVWRLVCEGKNGLELMFHGAPTDDGDVRVDIPALQEFVNPGRNNVHLEAIVDNKLFVPMNFVANFELATTVVAESVSVTSQTKVIEPAAVSASLIGIGKSEKSIKPRRVQEAAIVSKPASAPAKELTLRELYDRRNKAKAGK